ncbi:MAG: hypothetical protein WC438_00505 [Candidatus Pacearchaeota archaeon]
MKTYVQLYNIKSSQDSPAVSNISKNIHQAIKNWEPVNDFIRRFSDVDIVVIANDRLSLNTHKCYFQLNNVSGEIAINFEKNVSQTIIPLYGESFEEAVYKPHHSSIKLFGSEKANVEKVKETLENKFGIDLNRFLVG